MRIGVFDSGIGGLAIAQALSEAFPDADVTTVDDRKNVPYGTKSSAEILRLTEAALQPLLDGSQDVIVIACNTATAVAIETLRERYPRQKFIGLEPMVKPAASLSRTGVIAVCATPATLATARYRTAIQRYAPDVTVVEPDCSDWASLIESNDLNRERIDEVAEYCRHMNADVVILGCTHYHWIKDDLVASLGSEVQVLEPSDAIIDRVKSLVGYAK